MKHCAKKLLGLAFALALCLAVGGTALAQTPEFAEAPDTLPEQEMLAYEQNVTAEPGTKTTGNPATDGYQVTIPTTVTVDSTTAKGELMVKAQLKQYRTLNIGIESNNKWKLAYDDTTAADTPKVDYTLTTDDREDGKAIARTMMIIIRCTMARVNSIQTTPNMTAPQVRVSLLPISRSTSRPPTKPL